jgi:hypothetical protein
VIGIATHAAPHQGDTEQRRTKLPRAVQLLLGDIKFESTVCYLRIRVIDTLETAEQTEV